VAVTAVANEMIVRAIWDQTGVRALPSYVISRPIQCLTRNVS